MLNIRKQSKSGDLVSRLWGLLDVVRNVLRRRKKVLMGMDAYEGLVVVNEYGVPTDAEAIYIDERIVGFKHVSGGLIYRTKLLSSDVKVCKVIDLVWDYDTPENRATYVGEVRYYKKVEKSRKSFLSSPWVLHRDNGRALITNQYAGYYIFGNRVSYDTYKEWQTHGGVMKPITDIFA